MLHNAVGAGRVSDFPEKSVTKMYGSMSLAKERNHIIIICHLW